MRIINWFNGYRLGFWHHHLWVFESFGNGGMAKRAQTSERMVRPYFHAHVFALAFLLLLETHAKRAADRVAKSFAARRSGPGAASVLQRVFDGHETVTQPAASSAIAANVGEAVLVVTIRRAKGNLLYCLIHYQSLVEIGFKQFFRCIQPGKLINDSLKLLCSTRLLLLENLPIHIKLLLSISFFLFPIVFLN